jgi:transcriptional regulator with PAS, ATPase and Fis domain
LINVIERVVVTTRGDVITPEDLPETIRQCQIKLHAETVVNSSLRTTMEQVERQIIQEALETHKSTRKAALALGVNQSTVVRKMQRYGLSADDK